MQQAFYLEPEDIRSLFITDKRSKVFWELCLQYVGNNEAIHDLSKTMAHLCFRNYDFSRKIAKILVHGLNKTSADGVKPFAIAMSYFI